LKDNTKECDDLFKYLIQYDFNITENDVKKYIKNINTIIIFLNNIQKIFSNYKATEDITNNPKKDKYIKYISDNNNIISSIHSNIYTKIVGLNSIIKSYTLEHDIYKNIFTNRSRELTTIKENLRKDLSRLEYLLQLDSYSNIIPKNNMYLNAFMSTFSSQYGELCIQIMNWSASEYEHLALICINRFLTTIS
jgi:hypothetical protein